MPEISADLMKNPNLNAEMFQKIIQFIQKQHPKIEDDVPPDWLVTTRMIDQHDQTIIAALADVDEQQQIDHTSPLHWARRIPTNVRAHSLVYDYSNATGLTFPSEMDEELKAGAGVKTDGASYIVIDDHEWFNVTNPVAACWLKLGATDAGDTDKQVIFKKNSEWALQIDDHATNPNTLLFRVDIASTVHEFTYDYTALVDTWFSVIMYYDGTNLRAWINNVEAPNSPLATGGGTKDNTTNPMSLFARSTTNSQFFKSKNRVALLTFGDKDIITDSAWRTAYQNLILDWEDATDEEITTFPFIANYKAYPNSHSGFFWG